jgi:hypothetical protein
MGQSTYPAKYVVFAFTTMLHLEWEYYKSVLHVEVVGVIRPGRS